MRRELALLLVVGTLGGCSPEQPAPSRVPGRNVAGGPALTALTLDGVVSERIDGTLRPVAGATVELYMFSSVSAGPGAPPTLVRQAVTSDNGRYLVSFPVEAVNNSGVTPPGQKWEVRARKDGYFTATHTFEFVYSVWDYGGTTVSLELVR